MKFRTCEALAAHIARAHDTGLTESAMRAMDEWSAGKSECPWCDDVDDPGDDAEVKDGG